MKTQLLNHLFNFIAVILGVYLAFLINNKEIANRENKEGILILKSIQEDISKDIDEFENYAIPDNRRIQKDVLALIDVLGQDVTQDIVEGIANILQVESVAPTSTTYSSIKSAGKLSLINDLSLQKKLENYYEGLAEETTRKAEYQADYFTNEILEWLSDNVDLTEMRIVNQGQLIYSEIS